MIGRSCRRIEVAQTHANAIAALDDGQRRVIALQHTLVDFERLPSYVTWPAHITNGSVCAGAPFGGTTRESSFEPIEFAPSRNHASPATASHPEGARSPDS